MQSPSAEWRVRRFTWLVGQQVVAYNPDTVHVRTAYRDHIDPHFSQYYAELQYM